MPALLPRSVHVWVADLDCEAARAREVLASTDERLRAASSLRADAAHMRLRARVVLRGLFALYGGRGPFAPDGRDPLGQSGGDTRDRCAVRARSTHISVSHSHSLAVFAFAHGARVGVDVEVLDSRAIDTSRIAARAVGGTQAARLRRLPPGDARQREFLRLWTLHEARAKCTGSGIWAAASPSSETSAGREPWLTELSLETPARATSAGSDITAALAVARRPDEVRVLNWNADVQ